MVDEFDDIRYKLAHVLRVTNESRCKVLRIAMDLELSYHRLYARMLVVGPLAVRAPVPAARLPRKLTRCRQRRRNRSS